MKPQNKRQKRLVEVINPQIKKIRKPHYEYAKQHLFEHKAVILKSGKITCLDCGHSFQGEHKKVWHNQVDYQTCPKCNVKWKEIEHTRKKVFSDYQFLTVLEVVDDIQVIRYFKFIKNWKAGQRQKMYQFEVGRVFHYPNGKQDVVGYSRTSWWHNCWGHDFCLKQPTTADHYSFYYSLYPDMKISKALRRNGFRKSFHGMRAHFVFHHLLNNSKQETLWKKKHYALFLYYGQNDENKLNKFWPAMKLCLKHNYKVKGKDLQTYFDYLELCDYFNKDIRNVKYACPPDLNKRHNVLVDKKRKAVLKQKKKELREKMMKDQKAYAKKIKPFKHMVFKSGKITVKVIERVQDVLYYGDVLKHCIFVNDYHNKPNAILLVALEGDTVLETAEIKFRNKKAVITESRGLNNKSSIKHKEIVKLIDSNLDVINKAAYPPVQRKKKKQQLQVA